MERLTRYIGSRAASVGDMGDLKYVRATIDRLAAYEDTGLEPSEIPIGLELANVFAALQELKRYEDAEDQGLLVRLPCKVGDVVYTIFKNCGAWEIGTRKVVGFTNTSLLFPSFGEKGMDAIGKTVFLTRKAAESALAEMTDTAVK